jgi:hypothetical protein
MTSALIIPGAEVPLSKVAKRVMNFGQPIPGRAALPYEIAVDTGELVAALTNEHDRVSRELQHDATYDDTDAISEGLARGGWPSLAALAASDPALFARHLGAYLCDELIESLATCPAAESWYQINSVTGLVVTDQQVTVRGECYAMASSRSDPTS